MAVFSRVMINYKTKAPIRPKISSQSVGTGGNRDVGERWCKVNLCNLKKNSSAPGKINETESSEFWSEMRRNNNLDLNHFRVRNLHPNIPSILALSQYSRFAYFIA